jgi:hypothetical protein
MRKRGARGARRDMFSSTDGTPPTRARLNSNTPASRCACAAGCASRTETVIDIRSGRLRRSERKQEPYRHRAWGRPCACCSCTADIGARRRWERGILRSRQLARCLRRGPHDCHQRKDSECDVTRSAPAQLAACAAAGPDRHCGGRDMVTRIQETSALNLKTPQRAPETAFDGFGCLQ